MARLITEQVENDPGDGGGNPTPSDPAAPVGSVNNPAVSSPMTKLAKMVFGTSTFFTADEIRAAGGPWPKFKVRVTSVNNSGKSEVVEYVYSYEEPPPTNFTLQTNGTKSVLTFRNPTDANFSYVVLFRGATSDFSQAAAITGHIVGGLGEVKTVEDPDHVGSYYFIRAYGMKDEASVVVGPLFENGLFIDGDLLIVDGSKVEFD